MRYLLALAVFALAVLQATAAAAQAPAWYWCEPARAYYPYVGTCPVPWRAVGTAQPVQLVPPQPTAPKPTPIPARIVDGCSDNRPELQRELQAAQAEQNYLHGMSTPPAGLVGGSMAARMITDLNNRRDEVSRRISSINAASQDVENCIASHAAARQRALDLAAFGALGIRVVTVEEFELDGKKLAASGARLAISGWYYSLGQGAEYLAATPNPLISITDGVGLLTEDAERTTRATLLSCRSQGLADFGRGGCRISIVGHATLCERVLLPQLPPQPCLIVEDLTSSVLSHAPEPPAPTYREGTATEKVIHHLTGKDSEPDNTGSTR